MIALVRLIILYFSAVRLRSTILTSEVPIQNHSATKLSDWWESERAALVIAHPGHELHVHHWLERARPVTFILTDGSGHTGHPRTDSTGIVLARTGARRGAVFGAMSDRQLYRAILEGQRDLFVELAEELAIELQREGVTYVVGDAAEGFNPGHDMCRLILNAALLCIEATSGRRLKNMEFTLERPPQECPAGDRDQSILLTLDDEAYRRKVEAARGYPEMAAEIDRTLARNDAADFRTECCLPVRYDFNFESRFLQPCFYEKHGEKQVATGYYSQVIRFRDHFAPLATYLASVSPRLPRGPRKRE